ncbi:hypothetical protein HQQ81_01195 [Microbacteriaceae bacterium VKM Ac-2854]|nr:hypothetical protein [Microbacteriaceae bacterium VKM Ac-2854]
MKLKAGRPGRDVDDIRQLLAVCEVLSIEAAETMYEELYPGEVIPDRTSRILTAIVSDGIPVKPHVPVPPRFEE